MENKFDFLGNKLELGDEVVFMQLGYRHFWKGIITSMTDKTVIIQHRLDNTCSRQTKQNYNQVIKINKD